MFEKFPTFYLKQVVRYFKFFDCEMCIAEDFYVFYYYAIKL